MQTGWTNAYQYPHQYGYASGSSSTPNVQNYPRNSPSHRHPAIVFRTSEGVTQSSAYVSESDIRKWFSEIHDYLSQNNLLNIFNEPSRIYNCDESGLQLCPRTGKVLAEKGTQNVYKVDQGQSKQSVTVIFTFSADGTACALMVVYNYQRIPQKIADGVPKEWGIGRSENGWMTSELFFEYIANIFHPHLIAKGVQFPVIYFLDGHKTHLTYGVNQTSPVVFTFFKKYSSQPYFSSIRPGNKVGDPQVTDIRCLKYEPDGSIKFKLSHSEEYQLLPRRINQPNANDCFQQLYHSKLPSTTIFRN
ncbi:unnamed protein product [Pieris brassicae]|uniref:DDE-1 domain-containing protein n=1 Tax=Pieris brassicae TaxID=7116 RepID=A0A9P0TSA0_PIEBR|nr:unnamed protein product [Pieris brassicae]